MRIAICDDDSVQLKYIYTLVQKWGNAVKDALNISCYSNARELLFNYAPGCFDVLLLDIQMDGENGISLAKRIRSFNDNAIIIFITAVPDYVFDGYDVGAVQYLLKPVNEDKLIDCLNTALKNLPEKKKIIFESDSTNIAVSEDDIIYAEAYSHKTKIVLSDKEFFVSENISSVEQMLRNDFYKCHRSYIVNIRHVDSIKKYDVLMDNRVSIPVSRRIYNDFNNAFIAFYRR